MSKNIKATIEILEHYHYNGGFYEIPVEIINNVEQELEEQDKEIERLNNIIEKAIKLVNNKEYSFITIGDYIYDKKQELLHILKGSDRE